MKTLRAIYGLSDAELEALVESMPEGMAVLDRSGHAVWENRQARRLLALRATTRLDDTDGTSLGLLIARLIAVMPPFLTDERARWSVQGGGVVEVALRRIWGSQLAVWLSASAEVKGGTSGEVDAAPLSPLQLIVAERLLDEADVGLAVANAAGRIRWLNQQAERLLDGADGTGRDAQRNLARAARHVASGRLLAPIRMQLQLPTRTAGALFWNAAPHLAGVLFGEEQTRATCRPES